MHYLPNEVKSPPWKFRKLFSYNNEDKPVSSFFFDSYFDSYYVNVALNDSMDQWEKLENERNFTDKMNFKKMKCKKMKEILLTEKEMVFLVLLYFHVCMYVIFIILWQNYEKFVHAHNYTFLWNGMCFNYFVLTLWLKAGLFEGNLSLVGQYYPQLSYWKKN